MSTSTDPIPIDSNFLTDRRMSGKEDTVSAVALFADLWAARKKIVLVATVITLLLGALLFAISRFESEGTFQLVAPSIRAVEQNNNFVVMAPSFVEFKRIMTAVTEQSRVEKYLEARKFDSDPKFANLPKIFSTTKGVQSWIEPQWNLTRSDLKELADNGQKEGGAQLIGIRIKPVASNPQDAQAIARLIADYIRDTAFHTALTDFLRGRESDYRQSLLGFDERLISNRFQLKMLADKNKDLKAIGAKYPEAGRVSIGTVVSLSDSTIRYLPMPSQIVAVETSSADLLQAIDKAQRDRDQTSFFLDYYTELRKVAEKSLTGEGILKAMAPVREAVSRSRDPKDDKYRQVLLALELDAARLDDAFNLRSRFISGPTLPLKRNLNFFILIPAVFLISLFLAGVWVLLRRWWEINTTHAA